MRKGMFLFAVVCVALTCHVLAEDSQRTAGDPNPWHVANVETLATARPGADVGAAEVGMRKYLHIQVGFDRTPDAGRKHLFRVIDARGEEVGRLWGWNDRQSLVIFEGQWNSLAGLYLEGLDHREPLFAVRQAEVETPPAVATVPVVPIQPNVATVVERPRLGVEVDYPTPVVGSQRVLVEEPDRTIYHGSDRIVHHGGNQIIHDGGGQTHVYGGERHVYHQGGDRVVHHRGGGGVQHVYGTGGGTAVGGGGVTHVHDGTAGGVTHVYGDGAGGIGAGAGVGVGVGAGMGVGTGPGVGVEPGAADGLGDAIAMGPGAGPGAGPGPAPGTDPAAGAAPGQGPGEGTAPGQGPGEGAAPGQNPGEGTAPGQGPGEGAAPGQGPGEGTAPGQAPGEGAAPGQGPGMAPGEGPAPGPGDAKPETCPDEDGQTKDCPEDGPAPAEGPAVGPGAAPAQGPAEGPGVGPAEGPGTGPGEGPGGGGRSSGGPDGGPLTINPQRIGPRVIGPQVIRPNVDVPVFRDPRTFYDPRVFYDPRLQYDPRVQFGDYRLGEPGYGNGYGGGGGQGGGGGGQYTELARAGLKPELPKPEVAPAFVLYVAAGEEGEAGKVYQLDENGRVLGWVTLPFQPSGIALHREKGLVVSLPRDGGRLMYIDDTGKVSTLVEKDKKLVHPIDVAVGAGSDTILAADNIADSLVATSTGGITPKEYRRFEGQKWHAQDMSIAVTRDGHVIFGTDGDKGIYRFSGDGSESESKPLLPEAGGVAADTKTLQWAATQSPREIYVFEGEELMKTLRLPAGKSHYRNGLLSFSPAGSLCVVARDSQETVGEPWLLMYNIEEDKVRSLFPWQKETMTDFVVGPRMFWDRNSPNTYKSQY